MTVSAEDIEPLAPLTRRAINLGMDLADAGHLTAALRVFQGAMAIETSCVVEEMIEAVRRRQMTGQPDWCRTTRGEHEH